MAAGLHPWWEGLPVAVEPAASQSAGLRRLAAHILSGASPAVSALEARESADGALAGLLLEVEVERPQDLAAPIRGVEPIAVVFGERSDQPAVLAIRPDFPHTMHQNWMPEGLPLALCIDDRPWSEAQLSFTVPDFLRRIQLWLAKAARGELHDAAQPLEPLFFGSAAALIVPRTALAASESPPELAGFRLAENERMIVTRIAEPGRNETPAFVVLALRAGPQGMGRLRQAPATLDALGAHLRDCGIDLVAVLRDRIGHWAGLGSEAVRRLNAHLALVVAFPIAGADGKTADDLRAFITHENAGDIGVALGILSRNDSAVGSRKAYLKILMPPAECRLPASLIEPADVHLAFDRSAGAAVSGQDAADARPAVMIGAGSLGSQLAISLAREGRYRWTVVDNDVLLPHNLARHALYPIDAGVPKALGLARRLELLLGDAAVPIATDILAPSGDLRPQLEEKLSGAEIIIDASASVAVSRHLSALTGVNGRRLSLFFNPAGTALVLLAEDTARTVTLQDLEAQYHRMVQTRDGLASHLKVLAQGLRYSGSCRAVTNRIPAARAAQLSAIAAQAVADAVSRDEAEVRIWTIEDDMTVSLTREPGAQPVRKQMGEWNISYGPQVAADISALRAAQLPRETGGILLGIIDTSRRTVQVVCALAEPADSSGTVTGFERGVSGLAATVKEAAARSLHQIRYVGEWHSHPAGSSTRPSPTDIRQIFWLTTELENEGLPALMMIAGDNGALSVILAGKGLVGPESGS
jgi:integrative and conjugative element protein (TIGR02256 family)